VDSTAIHSLGYDPDGGRLEVLFPSGALHAYRNVPEHLWRQLTTPGVSVGRLFTAEIRGNPAYAYPTREEAAADGWRRRCPRCGQFAGHDHTCPPTQPTQPTLDRDRLYSSPETGVTLHMPNITAAREAARAHGSVTLPVTADIRGLPQGPATVAGEVVARPVGARRYLIDADRLACSCGQPGCAHRQLAAAEITDRLAARRIRTPERHAARRVLADLGVDHAASLAAQQRARTAWPANPEVSYTDTPQEFQRAYREARRRRDRGEPPVPYLLEDATGGLGGRDGGRGFGVELEFDFDASVTDRQAAMSAISRDLHAAGIARRDAVYGYHAGRGAAHGYSDAPDGWRLELDSTVAGEIVSPILHDEPATWRNLATVCDIVKRHGGRASVRAGGHVHVAVDDYDHTVENHNRLLGLFAGHQDTLYRLAQNPGARRHRGMTWCQPNRTPADGYTDLGTARAWHSGHHLGLNLGSVHGSRSDHVEYRMWDASLDPGVIQTQVKLSLGITEAAFRTAGQPGQPAAERVGTHRATRTGRPRGRRLRGQEWAEDTASFRRLVDTVFHRAADKAQAASLFAVTRWQRS
jgi:hypothetical protein